MEKHEALKEIHWLHFSNWEAQFLSKKKEKKKETILAEQEENKKIGQYLFYIAKWLTENILHNKAMIT